MTGEMDAVRALRDRGIDDAEALLQYGEPHQIVAACHRWDARQGVRPGLLVKWIRDQQFAEEPPPTRNRSEQLRRQFAERAPSPGDVIEPHATLNERCWPDAPDCPGDMIALASTYPLLELQCNECGFTAAMGPRDLWLLNPPEASF